MGSLRALFVEADDLGEVRGGEAVGAADAGVRDESASGPVFDPPGGTAKGFGDFLGAVETGQGGSALGDRKASYEGRGMSEWCKKGGSLLGGSVLGQRRWAGLVTWRSASAAVREAR
ncbi:hypothetical protein GCM10009863_19030 [Streptomyces axinellae]|uniref:Uncharacterized protein n=1 Tax=Streptomyces axinellae TaxID=552788 RepID=A0ABN3PY77_9ACTN